MTIGRLVLGKHFLDKAEETLLDFANAGKNGEDQPNETDEDEGRFREALTVLITSPLTRSSSARAGFN